MEEFRWPNLLFTSVIHKTVIERVYTRISQHTKRRVFYNYQYPIPPSSARIRNTKFFFVFTSAPPNLRLPFKKTVTTGHHVRMDRIDHGPNQVLVSVPLLLMHPRWRYGIPFVFLIEIPSVLRKAWIWIEKID